MKNKTIILRQLDQQLLPLKDHQAYLIPKNGWIRTLRKALGMTIKQLAKRLQVNPSRVVKIETSEIEGAITLNTLKTTAESLNCTFVYSFIPKTSLEKTIKTRAKNLVAKQLSQTAHTMELEAQSVKAIWLNDQVKELIDEQLQKSWKYLWEE